MDEDLAFDRRFSELIKKTMKAYRQGRNDRLEYRQHAQKMLELLR